MSATLRQQASGYTTSYHPSSKQVGAAFTGSNPSDNPNDPVVVCVTWMADDPSQSFYGFSMPELNYVDGSGEWQPVSYGIGLEDAWWVRGSARAQIPMTGATLNMDVSVVDATQFERDVVEPFLGPWDHTDHFRTRQLYAQFAAAPYAASIWMGQFSGIFPKAPGTAGPFIGSSHDVNFGGTPYSVIDCPPPPSAYATSNPFAVMTFMAYAQRIPFNYPASSTLPVTRPSGPQGFDLSDTGAGSWPGTNGYFPPWVQVGFVDLEIPGSGAVFSPHSWVLPDQPSNFPFCGVSLAVMDPAPAPKFAFHGFDSIGGSV